MAEACATIGRDLASIEVSAGIQVFDPAQASANGPEQVVGRAADVAAALRTWRDEGVAEVMCRMEPASTGLVERIARAAQEMRAG